MRLVCIPLVASTGYPLECVRTYCRAAQTSSQIPVPHLNKEYQRETVRLSIIGKDLIPFDGDISTRARRGGIVGLQ